MLDLIPLPYKLGILAIIVILAAGATKYAFHEHDALIAFKSSVEAAQKLHEAEDKAKVAETQTIITGKDADNEKNLLAVSVAWKSYADSLRNNGSANQGQKPARIVTQVCNGGDGDKRLSDALQVYRDDNRLAIAGERSETAKLLEVCQRQTGEWDNLKSSLSAIRQVNR